MIRQDALTSVQTPENYYMAIFDAMPGNILLVKNDPPRFTILASTVAYQKLTGYNKEDLLHKGVFEVFPLNEDTSPGGGNEALLSYQHVATKKEPHIIAVHRYNLRNHDGTYIEKFWRISNAPVFSANGEVDYIIHSAEDITAQVTAKKTEDAHFELQRSFHQVEESEQRFRALVTATSNVLFRMNADWSELLELHGRDFVSHTGKPIKDWIQKYIHPRDQDRVKAAVGKAILTKTTFELEHQVNSKDETPGWTFSRATPIFNDRQEIIEWFGAATNITNRKEAEEALQESEAKYRSLFESMDQGFCVFEMIFDAQNQPVDYRFLEINRVFEKQTGLIDAVGKTARELVPNLERHWFELYGAVATTGEPTRFTQGSVAMGRWFDVYGFRIGDHTSKKVALLFTDISEQKRNQFELIEKDKQLRNIIHTAPVPMLILRGDELVVDTINERMLQMINKGPDVLNKPLLESVPELKSQPGYERLRTVYQTGRQEYGNEILVPLSRDGILEERYFNFAYTPLIENQKVVGVMDVATEVTEQVKARKAIEEKSQELQLAIDVADLGHFRIDLASDVGTCSDRIMDWFGLSHHQVPISTILMVVHPEDRDRCRTVLDDAKRTQNNNRLDLLFKIMDPHTTGIRHLRAFGKMLPHKKDQPAVMLGVVQDVTQQILYQQHLKENEAELQRRVLERTIELESLNQELRRSNQNLEEFAHAASHDLKEPVRKIHFFTQKLKDQLSSHINEAQQLSFKRIQDATQRMGNLIDDLLLYSHVSDRPLQMENIDLNKKVQIVLEDLELHIQEKNAVISVAQLPVVTGYRRQLQQLLQNLIGNALKYSKNDVQAQIDITATKVTEDGRQYDVIEVCDNGIGFEQKYADQIFKMFARLHNKNDYGGTGVGLSIVKKVVENHSGMIRVVSSPGLGSSFSVYLPCS